MSAAFGLPAVIGIVVGASVVVVPVYFRKSGWIDRARRLALRNQLALSPEIELRVAHWLRSRSALSSILLVGEMALYGWSAARFTRPPAVHPGAEFFTAVLFLMPAAFILYGLAVAVPAWNSRDRRGVAHFTKPLVSETFTTTEWVALGAGAALALGVGGWFLSRTFGGEWWCLWPAALAICYGAWWWGSRTMLSRASRAANDLELQWDDLLRYTQVREFSIGVAWGPAGVAGFISAVVENGFPVLLGVLVLAAVGQYTIFRGGRDLWRQPWAVVSS